MKNIIVLILISAISLFIITCTSSDEKVTDKTVAIDQEQLALGFSLLESIV